MGSVLICPKAPPLLFLVLFLLWPLCGLGQCAFVGFEYSAVNVKSHDSRKGLNLLLPEYVFKIDRTSQGENDGVFDIRLHFRTFEGDGKAHVKLAIGRQQNPSNGCRILASNKRVYCQETERQLGRIHNVECDARANALLTFHHFVIDDQVLSEVYRPRVPVFDIHPLAQWDSLQVDASFHHLCCAAHLVGLVSDDDQGQHRNEDGYPFGPFEGCVPMWRVAVGFLLIASSALWLFLNRDHSVLRCVGGFGVLLFSGTGIWLTGHYRCDEAERENRNVYPHSGTIVLQKYLDNLYSCSTVIDMANVLSKDKQIAVVSALAEGSSIRSIERMTGINRNTIMNLGVRVGKGCTALLDAKMRDLPCRYLQFDEVWGFIGKKERHLRPDDDPQYGDVWTFCAIDAETKLVPSFKCGKRNLATAKVFVEDVASRMRTRMQVSSDALRAYVDAIEQVYGADVDYGQIVKTYEHDDAQNAERKYSAARFVSVEKRSVTGSPNMDEVSTSYIERLNATTRLHMRRLTRLTHAFSKKFENFEAAVGLHFAYYNLVRRHGSLRMTPAMAAGIERDFWSVGDLVEATA